MPTWWVFPSAVTHPHHIFKWKKWPPSFDDPDGSRAYRLKQQSRWPSIRKVPFVCVFAARFLALVKNSRCCSSCLDQHESSQQHTATNCIQLPGHNGGQYLKTNKKVDGFSSFIYFPAQRQRCINRFGIDSSNGHSTSFDKFGESR